MASFRILVCLQWDFFSFKSGAQASDMKPCIYLAQNPLQLKHNLSDTVILLFSRSVRAEAHAKCLRDVPDAGVQTQVARKMIAHTRKIAKASGFPVIFFSESQQQGANFAERYIHAFETIFAAGYSRVISIGNDCPDLKTQDLLKAANALQHQGMVRGLATDGGVFLLGFQKNAFKRHDLLQLAWQTDQVQAQLAQLYPEGAILSVQRSDLDATADFDHWANTCSKSARLFLQLKSLLTQRVQVFECPIPANTVVLLGLSHLRAPPFAA